MTQWVIPEMVICIFTRGLKSVFTVSRRLATDIKVTWVGGTEVGANKLGIEEPYEGSQGW